MGLMYRYLVTAAVACAAGGCRSETVPLDSAVFRDPPARATLRGDVVGCYALFSGDQPADARIYAAPEFVALTDAQVTDGAGAKSTAFRARAAGRNAPRDGGGFSEATWRADSLSDSVRIELGDGFNGVAFILAAAGRGDTIRGRAREWGDLGPTGWDRGPAEARRVPCGRLESLESATSRGAT